MLIAHECAHALYTPHKFVKKLLLTKNYTYVNVLEDTRIDKLIQKKYPVVRNYENGYDILDKKNFFKAYLKDINKDLMLIDKINMRSKSLNRLPFIFAPEDNKYAKVDNIVSFDDVVALAKEMIDCTEKQVGPNEEIT